MISFIKAMFTKKEAPASLSAFIMEAPIEVREKVLVEVVRRSNEDQRDLVERFHQVQKIT